MFLHVEEINAMQEKEAHNQPAARPTNAPYRMRLPGFVSDDDVGLGDVVKHVTSAIGIKPCGGCERRAAILNRWVTFSHWHV
jgi:hypothetical protein